MLIGLISDTHIPHHVKGLPEQLKEVFHGVDLILHAGDIYTVPVLDELECIAPVLAAEGDDDFYPTVADSRVKRRQVLTVDGITIWVTHMKPWSWSFLSQEASEMPPDIIVFGHEHEVRLPSYDDKGILWVCPGSATFPHYKNEPGTVGLLTLNGAKPDIKIIQLQ